jgi:sugar phosphate isomerase/epimerase
VALPAARASAQVAQHSFSSRFSGVCIGAQTYCYRSLRNPREAWSAARVDQLLDRVVAGFVEDQIDLAEFWIALIEPPGGVGRGGAVTPAREDLRKWRRSRPLEIFENARRKFNAGGIEIYSCMYNFTDDLTEDELDAAFDFAKALGTRIVSANCTVKSIRRAAPFADKHDMLLAAHSEDAPFDPDIDGMVFESNLVDALKLSPNMRVTLDTGHFTAYGGDLMKFVREHHDRVANLHLKDRLKNHPEPHTDENTTPFGKGDAPIRQVLQLMKREKYKFPACIEYEYKSERQAVDEMKTIMAYVKESLA